MVEYDSDAESISSELEAALYAEIYYDQVVPVEAVAQALDVRSMETRATDDTVNNLNLGKRSVTRNKSVNSEEELLILSSDSDDVEIVHEKPRKSARVIDFNSEAKPRDHAVFYSFGLGEKSLESSGLSFEDKSGEVSSASARDFSTGDISFDVTWSADFSHGHKRWYSDEDDDDNQSIYSCHSSDDIRLNCTAASTSSARNCTKKSKNGRDTIAMPGGFGEISLTSMSVEDIHAHMKDEGWELGDEDKIAYSVFRRSNGSMSSRYQYRHCNRCNDTGHRERDCPTLQIRACHVCGSSAHPSRKCHLYSCLACFSYGHTLRRCRLSQRQVEQMHCDRCGQRGHSISLCSDVWRQFYSTTDLASAKLARRGRKHLLENGKKVFCYNCGKSGHLGHLCKVKRMDQRVIPFMPRVTEYDKKQWLKQFRSRAASAAKLKSSNPTKKRHILGVSPKQGSKARDKSKSLVRSHGTDLDKNWLHLKHSEGSVWDEEQIKRPARTVRGVKRRHCGDRGRTSPTVSIRDCAGVRQLGKSELICVDDEDGEPSAPTLVKAMKCKPRRFFIQQHVTMQEPSEYSWDNASRRESAWVS